MNKASIRELHLRTSAIVREVEKGKLFIIEKRGVPVAEMRPVQRLSPADMVRRMEPIWARMPKMKSSSTKLISEDRDR
jgi:antitoxin (DNA-binding transcriptional repressor) of toxin-antitoxin stability system